MKAPLSYVPALPAAVSMAFGIICASLGAGWAVVVLALPFFVFFYRIKWHLLAHIFLFSGIGAMLAIASLRPEPPAGMIGRQMQFEAEAKQVEDMPSGARRCVLDIDGNLCIAYVRDFALDLAPGCEVAFTGRLSLLDAEGMLPGDYDISLGLRRQGILCQAYINPGTFRVVRAPRGLDAAIDRARSAMHDAIVSSPIDGDAAAFLLACILGDDSYLLDGPRTAFTTAGIAHVLALSGLHVGILASMLALLFLPLNLWRNGYVAKSVLTLVLVWAYAVVTGMSPSVMRASVMISAVVGARLLHRESFSANSLLLAAIVIMAFSPNSIFEAGFQLSFASVASILIVMRLLPKSLRRHPWLQFGANLLLLPMAAMAGSGIVYAFYFGEFPMLFLVSNIVAGILFPPILAGGFLLMLLAWLGIRAAFLGWLVDFGYSLLEGATSALASLPGATSKGLSFNSWAFLPYFASMGLLAYALAIGDRKERKAYLQASAGMAIVAFGVMIFCKPSAPVAELFIPKGNPQCLIARQGHDAYVLPLCKDSVHALEQSQLSHRGYLSLRGCEKFKPMPPSLDLGAISRRGNIIVAGDKSIILADNDSLRPYPSCTYALVAEGFASSMERLMELAKPDTVLLSSALHSSRSKRMMRECEGLAPCIDLRSRPLSIIINSH